MFPDLRTLATPNRADTQGLALVRTVRHGETTRVLKDVRETCRKMTFWGPAAPSKARHPCAVPQKVKRRVVIANESANSEQS